MMEAFSADRVLRVLQGLKAHQQLAVGASCCERMKPNYLEFQSEAGWGDIRPICSSLELIWANGSGWSFIDSYISISLRSCEAVVPESGAFTSIFESLAQDAVFAVCALLDFIRDGDARHVVAALEYSIDSVDLYVQENQDMDVRDPERERRILGSSLMQQELGRQERDLREARAIGVIDEECLGVLRDRARAESNLVLSRA